MRAGLADVNYLQVVVIALLGAMAASSFVGVIVAAALSVVIHVLVNALVPVLLDHKDFVPPVFDNAFMHFAASLFILYFVAIGVLFLIKMAVQHRPAPRVVTRHH
jgi:hypothetical protein